MDVTEPTSTRQALASSSRTRTSDSIDSIIHAYEDQEDVKDTPTASSAFEGRSFVDRKPPSPRPSRIPYPASSTSPRYARQRGIPQPLESPTRVRHVRPINHAGLEPRSRAREDRPPFADVGDSLSSIPRLRSLDNLRSQSTRLHGKASAVFEKSQPAQEGFLRRERTFAGGHVRPSSPMLYSSQLAHHSLRPPTRMRPASAHNSPRPRLALTETTQSRIPSPSHRRSIPLTVMSGNEFGNYPSPRSFPSPLPRPSLAKASSEPAVDKSQASNSFQSVPVLTKASEIEDDLEDLIPEVVCGPDGEWRLNPFKVREPRTIFYDYTEDFEVPQSHLRPSYSRETGSVLLNESGNVPMTADHNAAAWERYWSMGPVDHNQFGSSRRRELNGRFMNPTSRPRSPSSALKTRHRRQAQDPVSGSRTGERAEFRALPGNGLMSLSSAPSNTSPSDRSSVMQRKRHQRLEDHLHENRRPTSSSNVKTPFTQERVVLNDINDGGSWDQEDTMLKTPKAHNEAREIRDLEYDNVPRRADLPNTSTEAILGQTKGRSHKSRLPIAYTGLGDAERHVGRPWAQGNTDLLCHNKRAGQSVYRGHRGNSTCNDFLYEPQAKLAQRRGEGEVSSFGSSEVYGGARNEKFQPNPETQGSIHRSLNMTENKPKHNISNFNPKLSAETGKINSKGFSDTPEPRGYTLRTSSPEPSLTMPNALPKNQEKLKDDSMGTNNSVNERLHALVTMKRPFSGVEGSPEAGLDAMKMNSPDEIVHKPQVKALGPDGVTEGAPVLVGRPRCGSSLGAQKNKSLRNSSATFASEQAGSSASSKAKSSVMTRLSRAKLLETFSGKNDTAQADDSGACCGSEMTSAPQIILEPPSPGLGDLSTQHRWSADLKKAHDNNSTSPPKPDLVQAHPEPGSGSVLVGPDPFTSQEDEVELTDQAQSSRTETEQQHAVSQSLSGIAVIAWTKTIGENTKRMFRRVGRKLRRERATHVQGD